MKKILIVGLGNILLQDEGVGIHIIDRLKEEGSLLNDVELVYGETRGLSLLPILAKAAAIIFVDAMIFDGRPGDTIVLSGDVILHNNKLMSMHEVGLGDIVSLISLLKNRLPEIILIGVKPAKLEAGLQLSSVVGKTIPQIICLIKQEVAQLQKNLTEHKYSNY